MCKPIPHPHAEVIKAWADGIPIQIQLEDGTWRDIDQPDDREFAPVFHRRTVFRIKPQPSDFERYGVEVGDLWTTGQGETLTVAKKIPSGIITFARGIVVDNERLKTLLFRRGEVNKL